MRIFTLLSLVALSAGFATAAETQPNIVLIMADNK